MSLWEASRPKFWAKFETVFKKECFPKNEQDRNQNALDKCKVDDFMLVQYILKYRELVLKLDRLDNFQKVCGFLHGLDKDYQAKVKNAVPQRPLRKL